MGELAFIEQNLINCAEWYTYSFSKTTECYYFPTFWVFTKFNKQILLHTNGKYVTRDTSGFWFSLNYIEH